MDNSEPSIINGLKAIKTLLGEERKVISDCPFLQLPGYLELFNNVHAPSIEVIGQGRDLTKQIQSGSAEVKKEIKQFKDEFEERIEKERKKYRIAEHPGKFEEYSFR